MGVLCLITMSILRMPYAPLISLIIGLPNLIPFFGPILGTIPCAFLILMVDPLKAVIFVGVILVLQQIDSNLIYPRVVGDSVQAAGHVGAGGHRGGRWPVRHCGHDFGRARLLGDLFGAAGVCLQTIRGAAEK